MLSIIKSTKAFTTKEKIKQEHARTESIAEHLKHEQEHLVTNVCDMYIFEGTVKTQTGECETINCAGLMTEGGITVIVSGSVAVETISELIDCVNNGELTMDDLVGETFAFSKKPSKNGNIYVDMTLI